ncbi:MAG TPA: methionine--tRNA ligase [Chthoniobacteraceae bacterium]|nr:methionine--tRNA ligase [Chthoniobacteraceae bacterium]
MPKPFFITTAIDYTNGAPHIGHAYEKVLADVLARYHRLKGDDVFFLTGVDQHGQKVQQSAEKEGVAPKEFVDGITAKFLALWEKLEVKYDRWAATTDPLHKGCVQKILQRLWDEKQIYKDKQAGYYSVRQEQFLTDKERGPDGKFGPEWGEVEFREEENYYFKLAEHRDWLLALIDKRDDLITPEFRRAELRNAVEKLAGDLCISRPRARLAWGIPLTFDPEYVTFVWFDALVNYISFADYEPAPEANNNAFFERWPALHVIGKDIMIPAHGIYWPIMLHALGFTDDQIPPLLVHGWWNIAGAKMSKSVGNIVDPDALADKYGAEALRYYLMSDISTGRDSDFDEGRLREERYNGDLANKLGNLLNRALNMTARYKQGMLKRFEESAVFESPDKDQKIPFYRKPSEFVGEYTVAFDQRAIHTALAKAMDFAVQCNGFVELTAPWKLAKDPANAGKLDNILYTIAESLRIIAILVSPVLPKSAHGIFDQLQWKFDEAGKESRFKLADTKWGGLPDAHTVGAPIPLFPRIQETPPA